MWAWLIPPLLGVAAYFATSQGGVEWPRSAASKSANVREETRLTDVQAVLSHLEHAHERSLAEEEAKESSLDLASLKQELLESKQALAHARDLGDWDAEEYCDLKRHRLAKELGKRLKGEALEMILKEEPDLKHVVMEGWAEADASSAFQHVLESETKEPCSTATLFQLLQYQASLGNAALSNACARIPWELFQFRSSDPFSENGVFDLPAKVDVAPWIQSGSALALAKDGIQLGNLFSNWARLNPSDALAQWKDWPHGGDDISGKRAVEILEPGLEDPSDCLRIRHALAALPKEELARFSKELEGSGEEQSDRMFALYPELDQSHDQTESR